MQNRLTKISVNDNYTFRYSGDVMATCFDVEELRGNGPQSMREEVGDGCSVWFPKGEYIDKNGKIKSSASSTNWKNRFEKNGDVIVSYLYEGEEVSDNKKNPTLEYRPIHYTFFKEKGLDYFFAGVYLLDVNASKPRHQIFRRINLEINLERWYEHADMQYYNRLFSDWYDPVKPLYISKNIHKQNKLIKDFIDEYPNNVLNATYDYSNDLNLAKCHTEEDFFEHIALLSNKISEVFGDDDVKTKLMMSGEDWQDVAFKLWGLFDFLHYDHNDAIRKSELGQELAGEILAIYHPEHFLYGINQVETKLLLNYLGIKYDENDDLTELHCLLHFWLQCNINRNLSANSEDRDLTGWSTQAYFYFLKYAMNGDKAWSAPNFALKDRNESCRGDDNYKPESVDEVREESCFSWKIAGRAAIKTVDKSFIISGESGVPRQIYSFFECGDMLPGDARSVSVEYGGKEYSARIKKKNDGVGRCVISWRGGLNEVIQRQIEEQGLKFARFEKKTNCKFKLELIDEDNVDYDSGIETGQTFEKNSYANGEIFKTSEGKKIEVDTVRYERDPKLRKEAIRIHGLSCMACGFNFEEKYGERGRDYIEVHHLIPLYDEGKERVVNPETDMACLCANCHRMIHRKRDCFLSLDELKAIIR